MVDWKEMYLKMFRATEKATRILEEAQRECEELYMRDGDAPSETFKVIKFEQPPEKP